jgi:trehalose 6-phosphate phosphatase
MSRGDIGGHTTGVSTSPAEALAEGVRPLTEDPSRAAVFCDIDGTLAPIVGRADDAKVPHEVSKLLGRLGRSYGLVACVSGRAAAEARRLVGVGAIAYAGSHGAELLEPGSSEPELIPEFAEWERPVREFAKGRDGAELRKLRVRIEDKGAIAAFHWRGAADEDAAHAHLEALAEDAEGEGFKTHWGRKVLEIRPPVELNKGLAVRKLAARSGVRAALFGGDDATDLDAFEALDALVEEGELEARVRVGVRSDEGPEAIVESADIVVDGVEGFVGVLEALAEG